MLQAHIDDSANSSPSIYVLGGYLGDSSTWAKFADEWQEILDMRPRIEYFKMSEAMSRSGQFLDWSEERRNERVGLFRRIIEDHVIGEFAIAFCPDDLRAIYGKDEWFGRNAYYWAHLHITVGLARNLAGFSLPEQPIDFVFDNQMHEKAHVLGAWEFAKPKARFDPPSLATILRNDPVFRDDKDAPPLQAADMHAWCVRQKFVDAHHGRSTRFPFKERRQIRGMLQTWSEQEIRDYRETMRSREPETLAWLARLEPDDSA